MVAAQPGRRARLLTWASAALVWLGNLVLMRQWQAWTGQVADDAEILLGGDAPGAFVAALSQALQRASSAAPASP